MKISRLFVIFIVLCFLIPVAAAPWTFDQYATPKLALFSLLIALGLVVIIINWRSLSALPLSVKIAIGLFIAVQCFQAFRLPNPIGAFFGEYGQSESLLVQLGFILIFFTSYLLFSSGNPLRSFRSSILASTFVISGYGILEYFMTDPMTRLPVLRVKSLMGDPNSLGVFLILALPILFWDMASENRDSLPSRRRFYLSAAAIFLGITNLFLTFSRASWLGFLVVILIFFSYLFIQRKNHRYLLTLLCVIVILGLVCSEGLTRLQPQSHTDYELNARIASVSEGKDSGRKFLWSTAWTVFKTSPLIGYGIGTFQDSFHRYESKEAVNHWSPERDLREVHNETLHYLATQGLIGLIAYFGLLFSLGYAVWQKQRQTRNSSIPGPFALISALAGYYIFVQFAYPLLHYTFLCWVFWGMLLAQSPSVNLSPKPKPRFALVKRSLYNRAISLNVLPKYNVFPFTSNLKNVILVIIMAFILGGAFWFGYRISRADFLYQKAFAASHAYRYQQSLAYFPEIISDNPWVYQYRYRYAVTLIRASRQAEQRAKQPLANQYLTHAGLILDQLKRTYPSRYQIPFLSGEIWESRHHFVEANVDYRRSAALFPANYKLWYRIAKTDLLLGHKQKARSAWQIGYKISPSYMIFCSKRDKLTELLEPGFSARSPEIKGKNPTD